MHTGAVIALRVVLDQQLPVGFDVVLNFSAYFETRQLPCCELAHQRRVIFLKRHWIRGEIDVKKTFPLYDADPIEGMLIFFEPAELLHMRRADQLSIQTVCPGVVWTLDRVGELADGICAEPRATVAANVIECSGLALPVA